MEKRRKKLVLTGVVLLFACVSISFANTTYGNYAEFLKAINGLRGSVVDLVVEEDTVVITFRFTNESTWDLYLVNVQFNLYSGETFVGNFDQRERVYLGTGETDVVVRAQIYSRYVTELTGSEDITIQSYLEDRSHEIEWSIYGGAVIELPFEEETRTIQIAQYWVST